MTKKKDPKDLEKVGRPIEWTPEKLEKLEKELIAYVQREDVFHVSHFECIEKDHNQGWLRDIAYRHPEFQVVLKKAQFILGNKIITHAMIQGGDRWVINTLTPMYMDDVKKHQTQEKEEDLQRQMKFEEHKKSLGESNQEEMKPKIDEMIGNMNLAYENKKLREELKRLKGEK